MSTTMDRAGDDAPQNTVLGERAVRVGAYHDRSNDSSGLFPASAITTPMVEGKDVAGLIAAIAITLGPLAAYSLGLGA